MHLLSIPSPDQGVWHLGPVPLRAYAFCIILGIVVAVWLTDRRWQARGGSPGTVGDVAIWAVPFGIIGGRLYHVISSPQAYFGEGGDPVDALKIWNGGLGIWGAVTLGALGAWIGCRRRGIPLPPFGDALAPGLALAQSIGRWGNWFNQELFGRPTDLPWGLEIDLEHRPPGYESFATFHPTFLYESLWLIVVAGLVVWADRRFHMGHGRVFALYVMLYTVGRGVIETVRIDTANTLGGVRVNVWVSLLVFMGALVYFLVSLRLRPGREELVERLGAQVGEQSDADLEARSDP
jgi:prolipoprotein diacylglyceryl transferase